MIEAGKKAPNFKLKNEKGETVELKDFKGQKVVLYFYPKDQTPGCTTEACDFRDAWAKIKKLKATVLGVSPDSEASHQKFIAKQKLPFSLLVDEDHAVAEAYGAWGDKTLYGRKFKGIIRSTFVIDEDGKVEAVWNKVKVDGHVDEVLSKLS